MSGPWRVVEGPAGPLDVYRAGPAPGVERVLFVCPELPLATGGAEDAGRTYPALADRLAAESGWQVVTATLRGTGGSGGDFSAVGWLEDLGTIVQLEAPEGAHYYLAGFGLGGTLAIRAAADDPRSCGVACLGGQLDLGALTADPVALVVRCRRAGVIRTAGFPDDPTAWSDGLIKLDPHDAAGSLGQRPLLVVHGADDPEVPAAAARDLAASAEGPVDLRIVPGARHWLRADPRVVATLLGWLDRQG